VKAGSTRAQEHFRKNPLFSSSSFARNSKFPHARVKCRTFHSQQSRRTSRTVDNPVGLLQRPANEIALSVFQSDGLVTSKRLVVTAISGSGGNGEEHRGGKDTVRNEQSQSGGVVQPVRLPACHAADRRFESRPPAIFPTSHSIPVRKSLSHRFRLARYSTEIIDTSAMRRVTFHDRARLICKIAGECRSFT